MRLLLLLCLAALTGRAQMNVYDNTVIEPGFSSRDPVVVHLHGTLTLKAPGTYTASQWDFSGQLRMTVPGNYTVIASTGSITFNRTSIIRGLGSVTAVPIRLAFAHAGEFILGVGDFDPTVALTQGSLPVVTAPPLVNLSTRVSLGAGQTHVSGFVIGGSTQRRVLIRAIGPGLRNFGVPNPLATPVVTVLNNQVSLRTNSGWGGDPFLADLFTVVGAFPLPADSRDAAMVLYLNPGSYTVQLGGGAGEVLLEIYHAD